MKIFFLTVTATQKLRQEVTRCCQCTNVQKFRGGVQHFLRHTTYPRNHELFLSVCVDKEVVNYLTLRVSVVFKNKLSPRFSIIAIYQTSTTFLSNNMITSGRSGVVWWLSWLMRSRIQMCQLTSTTLLKMSMISWSRSLALQLWIHWPFKRRLEIVDKEIKIWQTRTVPFPKDKNHLESTSGVTVLFIFSLDWVRRVLAIPAISTAPERLFSTVGNVT